MDKQKPLMLSVVIPVYNAKDVIEGTVERIESVTRVPDEIILIDDGSTDGSGDICNELAERHDNIKVRHQSNAGIAEARNAGIEAACGDYICFVDQDDVPSEEMYELGLLAASRLSDADSVGADVVLFSTGRLVNGKKSDYEVLSDCVYDEETVRTVLLPAFLYRGYEKPDRNYNIAVTASIWKCMIRRGLLVDKNIRFKRFVSYEDDYIMMIELLCNAKSAVTSSHRGYYWVINELSESHSLKYIDAYGDKLMKLDEYLSGALRSAAVDDEMIRIFSEQLRFEKTIDVIANESVLKSRDEAEDNVKAYLSASGFFDIENEHIMPLLGYRRLKMLYKLKNKGDARRITAGVRRFLRFERFLHSVSWAGRLLKK